MESPRAGASPTRPAGISRLAHVDEAVEERAGGQNHGSGLERRPLREHDPYNSTGPDEEVLDRRLDDGEAARLGNRLLHRALVELAVGLGTRALHGRPPRAVEQAELDAGGVGYATHEPVEGVDLADQMALAEPADGGVAGHFADRRGRMGDESRCRAHARGGSGRLAAGVASTDDNDIEACAWHVPKPRAA